MPKKTKKQKLMAELRRLRPVENNTREERDPVSYSLPTQSIPESPVRKSDQPREPETTARYAQTTAVIHRDLLKILVLSGLALAFEFALYWLWEVR